MRDESDPLSVGERQEFVVVHDGVHVLDPQRVHVAVVKNVPSFAFF